MQRRPVRALHRRREPGDGTGLATITFKFSELRVEASCDSESLFLEKSVFLADHDDQEQRARDVSG